MNLSYFAIKVAVSEYLSIIFGLMKKGRVRPTHRLGVVRFIKWCVGRTLP